MAGKDATKDGVSEEQKKQNDANPRDLAIERLAQNALSERAGEFQGEIADEESEAEDLLEEGEENPEPTEDEEMAASEEEEGDAEKDTEEEEESSPEDEEEEEELIEVKIDGEKKRVPLSKVIDAGQRTFQKETAADKRLEEATRVLKEVREAKESLMALQLSLSAAKKEDVEEKKQKTTEEEEETISLEKFMELADAIRYGEEEEAAKALKQLTAMSKSETPRSDGAISLDDERFQEVIGDITSKIESKLTAKQIQERFHLPKEQGGFGDIVSDEDLYQLAVSKVNDLLAGGAPNTWETYQKVGMSLREKFLKEPEPTQEKKKESDLQKKKEKKKSVDTVKGVSQKSITEEESAPALSSEPERSNVIREIKRQRGQLA